MAVVCQCAVGSFLSENVSCSYAFVRRANLLYNHIGWKSAGPIS